VTSYYYRIPVAVLEFSYYFPPHSLAALNNKDFPLQEEKVVGVGGWEEGYLWRIPPWVGL